MIMYRLCSNECRDHRKTVQERKTMDLRVTCSQQRTSTITATSRRAGRRGGLKVEVETIPKRKSGDEMAFLSVEFLSFLA